MDASTTSNIASGVVAFLGICAAVYERMKSEKAIIRERATAIEKTEASKDHAISGEILKQKDELIALAREASSVWKGKFEDVDKELHEHRAKTHDKAEKDNARMLSLAEENAALRIKTDLTPLLNSMSVLHTEQRAFNSNVIAAMNVILKRLGVDDLPKEPILTPTPTV